MCSSDLQSLRCAALTMNVAMTALQNQLAQQSSPLNAQQRAQVDAHPARAVEALRGAGVDDALWLEAVLHHHDAPGGPLAGMEPAQRLARLIRRADVFAARMSPRRGRLAMSATAAARMVGLYTQGQNLADPRLRLDFAKADLLPPILIQVGGFEMLRADARYLDSELRWAGGTSTLEVWPGMVHVFQALPHLAPEAAPALRRAAAFIADVYESNELEKVC